MASRRFDLSIMEFRRSSDQTRTSFIAIELSSSRAENFSDVQALALGFHHGWKVHHSDRSKHLRHWSRYRQLGIERCQWLAKSPHFSLLAFSLLMRSSITSRDGSVGQAETYQPLRLLPTRCSSFVVLTMCTKAFVSAESCHPPLSRIHWALNLWSEFACWAASWRNECDVSAAVIGTVSGIHLLVIAQSVRLR